MTAEPATRTPVGPLRALVRACRPRQWVKNVLVLAAPLAGGALESPHILGVAVVAAVAFVLASASVYLVNDLVDVDLDRAHPTKRRRPIASGDLPLPLARTAAVLLAIAAVGIAALTNRGLLLVVAVYLMLSVAYSLRLKREPVVELFIVASGFLLRALAGALATGVPLSDWFILTAGFGSLFVAAGKRYAELSRADAGTAPSTRPVLASYSSTYLRFVWTLSAAAVSLTYAQWALTGLSHARREWAVLSIVPFLMALLRYAVDVDRGSGGEPEEIITRDRTLLVLGLLWVACLGAAFYL